MVNETARAWNKATRRRVKFEDRLKVHSELKQVWFPGYHVNIGGGSSDTLDNVGDMEEMSNITYSWMLDQIKSHLSIDERFIMGAMKDREEYLQKLNQKYENWEASVNASKRESIKEWVVNAAKSIVHPVKALDPPEYKGIRRYGWGEGILLNSFTSFYYLNGKKWRTPGEYGTKNGKYAGETFEYIHPVVNYRVERMKQLNKHNNKLHALYKPLAPSSNYKRWKETDDQGNVTYKYTIGNSTKVLPEWKLGVQDSYERLAIAGLPAYEYVDVLDDEVNGGFRTERFDVETYGKTEFGLKPSVLEKLRASDAQKSSDGSETWGEQSQSTVFDPSNQPGELKASDISNLLAGKAAALEALNGEVPHQNVAVGTVH